MALERGGLRYPIEVVDQFSATLGKFRDELAKARKEFEGFRNAAQSAAGVASAATTKAATLQAKATQEAARANDAYAASTQEVVTSANQQAAASRKNVQAMSIEAQARRQLASDQRRQAIELRKNAIIDETGINLAKKRSAAEIQAAKAVRERAKEVRAAAKVDNNKLQERFKRARDEFLQFAKEEDKTAKELALSQQKALAAQEKAAKRASKQMQGLGDVANRVSFTFRRLFGILAAFTIAREIVTQFRNMVSESLRFNASLETAKLGIASLLTAAGDIRDAFGNATDSTQGLAIAQKEAQRQMGRLRQDALKTSATFEELLQTFQTAVAPGLAAGLNLDEIRTFSVRISQAATALGLAQNQLAEEIRSILQGTIQARNTRIATALGITNDDIKRAKEAGQLAEFLRLRFEAFGTAGEEAINTFTGLVGRVKEAFQLLLGQGSLAFFEEMKASMREIIDLIAPLNEAGDRIINPKAVETAQALFDILKQIVVVTREFFAQFTFEGAKTTLEAIGNIVGTITRALSLVASGVVTGFAAVAIVIGKITGLVTRLVRWFLDTVDAVFPLSKILGGVLQAITAIVTAAVALRVVMLSLIPITKVWAFLVGSVTRGWALVVKQIKAAVVALRALNFVAAATPIGLLLVAASTVAVILADVLGLFQDSSESVEETVKDSETLANVWERIRGHVSGTRQEVDKFRGKFVDAAKDFREALAELDKMRKTLGVEGAAGTQAETLLGANFKAQEESRELSQSILSLQGRINDLQTAKVVLQGRFNNLQEREQDQIEAGLLLFKLRADEEKKLADATKRSQLASLELQAALGRGDLERAEQAQRALDMAKQEQVVARANIGVRARSQERLSLTQQAAEILEKRVSLEGEERTLVEALTEAERARLQLALEFAAASLTRVQASAEADTRNAKREAEDLRLQAQATRELVQLQQSVLTERERAIFLDNAELRAANLRIQRIREESDARLASLEDQKTTAREFQQAVEEQLLSSKLTDEERERLQERLRAGKEAELAIVKQINAEGERRAAQLEKENEEVAKLLARQAANAEIAASPAFFGVAQGFIEFERRALDMFNNLRELTSGILTDLSSGIADAIVEGFGNGFTDDNIKETLGNLLKQIAQRIIQMLVEIAIVKAALGLGLGPSENTRNTLGAAGLAEGGPVPRRAGASPAHFGPKARGLVRGGRPAGLDPRDTVPIWAQPGEFMQPLHAVRRYGLDVMEAIRRGAVDPTALRSLAGVSRVSRHLSRPRGAGFAEGGSIPASVPQGEDSGVTVLPVMVADNKTMERQLKGGHRALMQHVAAHKSEFNAILGR